MCGIAGIIGDPALIHDNLPGMLRVLASRGPDGQHFATYSAADPLRSSPAGPPTLTSGPAVGLGHQRLAILDTSTDADQPFFSKDGTHAVVHNGEIYNFLELRRELEQLGEEFRTDSDTEVLLATYRAWGPACVERFVGMWAFAIVDTTRGIVFVARDRFGIKPLYLTRGPGYVAFASEIKALLQLAPVDPHPNEQAVARYLTNGEILDNERTFFEGIEPFPAAAWAEIDIRRPDHGLTPTTYWHVPEPDARQSVDDSADEFRECFLDAVALHLRSDVPIGTCLSGGIDSSSIVAAAASAGSASRSQHPYLAFGFCSDDEQVSERAWMELVAARTGVQLVPVTASPQDVAAQLEDIVDYHDEPFGSASIVAQWFVFGRAKEAGVKVLLDGQGADEMLGGYHWYLQLLARGLARKGRLLALRRLRRLHEREIGPMDFGLAELAGAILPRSITERVRPRDHGDVLRTDVVAAASRVDRRTPSPPPLGPLLTDQLTATNLPQLLRYEDRNSMHHSIEARVPFLDHRLVELVFRMSDDQKISGAETKVVLRRAMRGLVPDEVLDRRDKVGFRATPTWTFDYAARQLDALTTNDTEHERAWFDEAGVAALLRTERRDVDTELMMWRVINTKLWARTHLR